MVLISYGSDLLIPFPCTPLGGVMSEVYVLAVMEVMVADGILTEVGLARSVN
jgi:hypothetical protein